MAIISDYYYGQCSNRLKLIGVTGTNGKKMPSLKYLLAGLERIPFNGVEVAMEFISGTEPEARNGDSSAV